MRPFAIALLLVLAVGSSAAKTPACSGPDNWAAAMAHAQLKNANLTNNESLDFSKTRVTLLASGNIEGLVPPNPSCNFC
jgi:hypothetical protein